MSRAILLTGHPTGEQTTIFLNPTDNVQAIINNNPAGTSFTFNPGIFRMLSLVPKNDNIFDGLPGAVINGSRLLTSFAQSGNTWYAIGQTQQGQISGECLAGYPRCNRPEDLFINNVPMLHVATLNEVAPGKWFFDYTADRVYIGDNPVGKTVEVGVTPRAFGGSASGVTIKNLTIEKYAAPVQNSAIMPGTNWTIQSCTIRFNHGGAVSLGEGLRVLQCRLIDNGQQAFSGSDVDDFLFENNEMAWNNYAGVDPGWEAGGGKIGFVNGGTFRGNCVHDNNGPGLWADTDAYSVIYENNYVYRNTRNGIQYETSYDGIIRNNTVFDNGLVDWFWGPQILISSSRGCKIYGNTVDCPSGANAITIVSQDRPPSTPAINNEIYGNFVTIRATNIANGGRLGAVTDVAGDIATVAANNSMHNNTYHLANINAAYWTWNGSDKTWSQITAYGQESGSTADTSLPNKPPFSCP